MNATTLNLASLLDSQARVTPERTALVCGAVRLTYAELHARVCQLAVGLRLRGLGPGDHIALSCPNTPHFVMAYFAILKLGGVVVPLNVLLKPREIEYHLRDSDAKALLVFEGAPGLPMAAMAREACDRMEAPPPIVVMTIAPGAPGPIHGAATLGELMHGQPATCVSHPTAPDDTAVMLYTSGTTGQAKGAELTHLNMTLNAIAGRDLVMPALDNGVAAKNVTLITLPLFHSFGQTALLNAAISGGFTAVLMPRMDPATVFQAFAEEQVLWWAGVPTMFWALLQYARAAGPAAIEAARSLRVCMSGGAPLPVQLLKDFQETFGVQVLEGYGLSETSPIASFNQMHRPSKPGTVGLPISGCEIAVVNDRDDALPAGRAGEVVIRGHNIMKGYYKRPAETREALRGGWFHTGDIGVIDEDGYLAIIDRKKDLIIRGGLNVYPREVEEVLQTHAAVSLAAVVGVPDERLGEEVKAYVVRKAGADLTEEALLNWCKEQMAAFKYPRSIEFRDSLPMGPTGKVLKRALR